jgi:hypothetical protein
MAKLDASDKIAEAIFAAIKAGDEDWRRNHLGASLLGSPCSRALWYGFRWAVDPDFGGRMLRLFERGHREEDWVIENLRSAGMEVWCVDTSKPKGEDGKHPQFRMSWLGGHIGGGVDGVILGVPGAPKTPHLGEIKTSNDKRFKILQRGGVRETNPRHYTQMQIYMLGMKLKRALYICVNKNTDDIHSERITFDKKFAEGVIAKAEMIVGSNTPLTKLSDDPSWWECKFCDYRPICHGVDYAKVERNCRTCSQSTPKNDGAWICEHHGITLDCAAQRKGCDSHLHIPQMLEQWNAVGYDEEKREVTYHTGQGPVIDDGKDLRKP